VTTTTRSYTTRRQQIIAALVTKLQTIDGTGDFLTDLGNNVLPKLLFWDEVDAFPAVHVQAGAESREYQGGGYKNRFLSLTLRCYVKSDEAVRALDELLEDVETVVESNSGLTYVDKQGITQRTHQTTIVSIDTDEGVLEPLGVGEMIIEVQY
jgi:hypothetical protein|tara:strand:- start:297 stop:755 length:459 start_codon:yes stop_codon:yes gene_type:complete